MLVQEDNDPRVACFVTRSQLDILQHLPQTPRASASMDVQPAQLIPQLQRLRHLGALVRGVEGIEQLAKMFLSLMARRLGVPQKQQRLLCCRVASFNAAKKAILEQVWGTVINNLERFVTIKQDHGVWTITGSQVVFLVQGADGAVLDERIQLRLKVKELKQFLQH
jgi:hypothetical protein